MNHDDEGQPATWEPGKASQAVTSKLKDNAARVTFLRVSRLSPEVEVCSLFDPECVLFPLSRTFSLPPSHGQLLLPTPSVSVWAAFLAPRLHPCPFVVALSILYFCTSG